MVYSEQDLTNINFNLSGNYALAGPLDFFPPKDDTLTAFAAAPIASLVSQPFTGTFTGLGNTISNLTILDTTPVTQVTPEGYATNGDVGLFGAVGPSGVVRDVNLAQANVQGTNGMSVGALVGANEGTMKNSPHRASSSPAAASPRRKATRTRAPGSGRRQRRKDRELVVLGHRRRGRWLRRRTRRHGVPGRRHFAGSSASGSVIVGSYSGNTADPVPDAGGLVGLIYGYQFGGVNPIQVNVSNSFATGAVSGGSGTQVGGFAGVVDQERSRPLRHRVCYTDRGAGHLQRNQPPEQPYRRLRRRCVHRRERDPVLGQWRGDHGRPAGRALAHDARRLRRRKPSATWTKAVPSAIPIRSVP